MDNKVRILVVDDQSGMCDFLSHYLKTRGYEAEVAHSAEEALEALKKSEFDLVLSDIMMPFVDGLDLLREIKKSRPGVAVILMTAYASLDKAMKAIKYGAADLLIKPFEMSALVAVVEKTLGKPASSSPSPTDSSV